MKVLWLSLFIALLLVGCNTSAAPTPFVQGQENLGTIATSESTRTVRLEFKERTCTDPACITFTDADLGLTGEDLTNAVAVASQITGQWGINIQFNSRGTDIFSDLTQRIVGERSKRIAVFLDDELIVAPVSSAWIRNGQSRITGNFTEEEARRIASQMGHQTPSEGMVRQAPQVPS